jgi:hypothetical protein
LSVLTAGAVAKECHLTDWTEWAPCTMLCGPSGTRSRYREVKKPLNQQCTVDGLPPVLEESEGCNRKCLNGGKLKSGECVCKSAYGGVCCQEAISATADKCHTRLRKPDGGNLKCGKTKSISLDGSNPWHYSCAPVCPKGSGMYRARGDIYTCNHQGWGWQNLAARSLGLDDYDDSTPVLPIADCSSRRKIMGTSASLSLVYASALEQGALDEIINGEDPTSALPASLLSTITSECSKKIGEAKAGLKLVKALHVTGGNIIDFQRMEERRLKKESKQAMLMDYVATDEVEEVEEVEGAAAEEEEAVFAGTEFSVEIELSVLGKSPNIGWSSQEMSRRILSDCVGSILSDFEATDGEETKKVQFSAPEGYNKDEWPYWDRAGSGCEPGSILIGGTAVEPLECQACPRGTIFVSKEHGRRQMCIPCPVGSYMNESGQTHNRKGVEGQCDSCPGDRTHVTTTFPAYTQDTCQKLSCFPNRSKFQVVFAMDSSGSVTRPDYIRMREFTKSIVSRMCINNGNVAGVKKSCGQAGYVIYNTSPESYLKFKQVNTVQDYVNKIDNYEYRGGAPRIGDLFEFIDFAFIDKGTAKRHLPLNLILISDGDTQNDDKPNLAKWSTYLKQKMTNVITIAKRSHYNENLLGIASTLEDQYFVNDYHELPNLVHTIMERLCQSVAQHKGWLKSRRDTLMIKRALNVSKRKGRK